MLPSLLLGLSLLVVKERRSLPFVFHRCPQRHVRMLEPDLGSSPEQLVRGGPVEIFPERFDVRFSIGAVIHEIGVFVDIENNDRKSAPHAALIVSIRVVYHRRCSFVFHASTAQPRDAIAHSEKYLMNDSTEP